jgi:hypothetical protein
LEQQAHERHTACHVLININHLYASELFQRQRLRVAHGANGRAHIYRRERHARLMSAYPQVHTRFESLGEPYSTVTILIKKDSPATIARQLETVERLITWCGAHAFFGEPPRQIA